MDALKYKLQGTTLVETLIAITILVFCITMASIIILNVTRSANRFDKVTVYLLLQRIASENDRSSEPSEMTWRYDRFTIEKNIKPTDFSHHLLQLELIARDTKGRVLGSYSEYFIREYETDKN